MASISNPFLPPSTDTSTALTSASTDTTSSTTTTSTSTPPTSTSTTSTTSSTSTTSTTSSTSSTTSSTSSTTSTTSSTSSTTSSSSTSTTSSTSFTTSRAVIVTTDPQGRTTTVFETQTSGGALPTTSASSDATSGSKSFFNNKGAVAGVFTAVGLIALVLLVALATNAVRRRRARKFDDEVAAAAAEAAATAPRYPFDDEYDSPGGGNKYGVGSYSDPESHGTLSQPPMSVAGESYNMNELSGYNPSFGTGAAAAGAGALAGAGAAGIGANRSMSRREPGAAYADYGAGGNIAGFGSGPPGGQPQQPMPYNQPYNAFADDSYDRYAVPNSGLHRNGTRGAADFGYGAAAGAVGTAVTSDAAPLNRGPSQSGALSLNRTPSQGAASSLSGGQESANGGAPTHESYAAHYQPDFRPGEHKYAPPMPPVPPAGPTPGATSGSGSELASLPNPFAKDATSDEDAYGAESYFPTGRDSHDESASIRDEEDYGRAGRKLTVANE